MAENAMMDDSTLPVPIDTGRGRISTVWESNCCPSPLIGSSRSEQRAKLTGLS